VCDKCVCVSWCGHTRINIVCVCVCVCNVFTRILFFFTQHSIGVGLEDALITVLWVSILVFVVGSLFLPSLMLPLMAGGAFIFYIVVVPAAAWHYSPRCWLLTPSFPIGGGMNVPIWPVPVAFPALPECALDEIVALADKYAHTHTPHHTTPHHTTLHTCSYSNSYIQVLDGLLLAAHYTALFDQWRAVSNGGHLY
jgi:hypothetical protein